MRCWPREALLLLLSASLLAGRAHASCDMVPTKARFNGVRGTIDRPFASPGTRVELRQRTCDAGDLFVVGSSHRVTLLFEPPGGTSNAVVVMDDCDDLPDAQKIACAGALGGGSVTCVDGDAAGIQVTGHVGRRAFSFAFPDTDVLVGTSNDDLTLSGPLTIVATPTNGASLHCELVATRCRDLVPNDTTVCIDELYAGDETTCATTERVSPFDHLTALPPPNAFQDACVSSQPPCTASAQNMRLAVDAHGDLLLPMGWDGVLADDDGVPVPRILRATWAAPIDTLAPGLVGTYNVYGVQLPPVFESRIDPALPESVFTLLGSADVATTVLRIAARGAAFRVCTDGPRIDLPCNTANDCPEATCGQATCTNAPTPCSADIDCPGGECGPRLFDFSGDLVDGIGPVVIPRGGAGFCEIDPTLPCASDAGCTSGPCVTYKLEVGEELSGIPAGPPGDLDPTFGDEGSVLLGTGRQRDDTLHALVLQPDGKYVALASSHAFLSPSPNVTLTLFRLAADGSLDADFGVAGVVSMPPAGGVTLHGADAALQSDGKIVVAGSTAPDGKLFVLRLDDDGGADGSFGSGGRIDLNVGAHQAHRVFVRADRTILVAATTAGALLLVRLDEHGVPDPSFGTAGVRTTPFPALVTSLVPDVLLPDGRLLAVGGVSHDGETALAAVRLDVDGSVDATFGSGGVAIVDAVDGEDELAHAIAVQPSGRLVVVGGSEAHAVMARLHPGGGADASFGTAGVVVSDLPSAIRGAHRAVVVQPDGRIATLAADANPAPVEEVLYAVRRYDEDGGVDPAFAHGGPATARLGRESNPRVLLLLPDGRLVASGHTCCDRGRVNDVSLTRFLGNPAVCGNGLLEFPELCDDANLSNEDGCDSNCTPGRCGNRLVTNGETCDEGGATPTCDADCTAVACGDGHRNLAAGEECDDGNLDDGDGCTAACAIACPPLPRADCRHAGKSQILLKRGGPAASRKLQWIWKQGDAITFDELGDPAVHTEYRACLYDGVGGTPVLSLVAGIAPGGDCGRGACWKPTTNRQRYWSPVGADGIKILTVTSGAQGRTKMQLQASGAELDAPLLPLSVEPALVAQLVNGEGTCWEAVFPQAGVRQNANGQFKAGTQ